MSGRFALSWAIIIGSLVGTILAVSLDSLAYRVISSVPPLLALLITGYHVWSKERTKLITLQEKYDPKLTIEFDNGGRGFIAKAPTNIGGFDTEAVWVRVLPTCSSRVSNCIGQLTCVYKWENGQWNPTQFDERLDLTWANKGNANPLEIFNGARQFLDVLMIRNFQNNPIINLTTPSFVFPSRAAQVFNDSRGVFRIDIVVIGDQNANAQISLRIHIKDEWDKPEISRIS